MTEQPRPAVTIYDVAKAAGVAPSTVSRAFARPGRVNAETAARIRKVADELGYRANPVSQALSSSSTRLLGLMVSDVANPFYSQLIRGAQLAATEAGYEILLADSRESGKKASSPSNDSSSSDSGSSSSATSEKSGSGNSEKSSPSSSDKSSSSSTTSTAAASN